jgi:hypothetical protein
MEPAATQSHAHLGDAYLQAQMVAYQAGRVEAFDAV